MSSRKKILGLTSIVGFGFWLMAASQPNEKPILKELPEISPVNSEEKLPEITPDKQEITDPKEAIREEARRAFGKMNDYTFRIFSPCNMGTGWILDYEIPEDNSYPTTWYIATNLHVVSRYGFSENPYRQKMPKPTQEINNLRYKYRNMDYSKLSLFYDHCNAFKWYGYFDFNMAKEDTGEALKSDMGLIANKKIEEPKLFYAALNFLKDNDAVDKNHWKDFAVIEIKFNDKETARTITNDFATKYPVDTKEAINVFADALEDRYSFEQIANTNQNFYSFGYPATGDKFKASKTWNEETLEADRVSNDRWNWYHEKDEEKVPGFVVGRKISRYQEWGSETYIRMGHLYFFKNFPLGKGSSGSMYVDGNNNLLGLKAVVETGKNSTHSWVEPIRSKGFSKGRIKTPKYDLLLGGDNQISSYRQQVETYNKNTFLRKRGWKHIS